MDILKYFFCLESQLDIRVYPLLHEKIQNLIDHAEIIFCLFFIQEYHHLIRQKVPEPDILESKILFQIFDLFPDIISQNVFCRTDVDHLFPVFSNPCFLIHITLQYRHCGIAFFRCVHVIGCQVLFYSGQDFF